MYLLQLPGPALGSRATCEEDGEVAAASVRGELSHWKQWLSQLVEGGSGLHRPMDGRTGTKGVSNGTEGLIPHPEAGCVYVMTKYTMAK